MYEHRRFLVRFFYFIFCHPRGSLCPISLFHNPHNLESALHIQIIQITVVVNARNKSMCVVCFAGSLTCDIHSLLLQLFVCRLYPATPRLNALLVISISPWENIKKESTFVVIQYFLSPITYITVYSTNVIPKTTQLQQMGASEN